MFFELITFLVSFSVAIFEENTIWQSAKIAFYSDEPSKGMRLDYFSVLLLVEKQKKKKKIPVSKPIGTDAATSLM